MMGIEGRGRLVGHIFRRAWEYSLAVMGLMAIKCVITAMGIGEGEGVL